MVAGLSRRGGGGRRGDASPAPRADTFGMSGREPVMRLHREDQHSCQISM